MGKNAPPSEKPAPPVTAEARGGEVLLTFKKRGHLGVWIESQIGGEAPWGFLSIDTTSPYHDTRPLKVPGQPEKRSYRLCYWDGEPTNAWTPTYEVAFGG